MNTIKIKTAAMIILLISCIVSTNAGFGQTKKTDTVMIKTSAVCGMCKDRIEQGLAFEKGVKDVVLDRETHVATIRYNPKSTNPEELRRKISKLGYDADEVPADPVAYQKLPACCKKDNAPH